MGANKTNEEAVEKAVYDCQAWLSVAERAWQGFKGFPRLQVCGEVPRGGTKLCPSKCQQQRVTPPVLSTEIMEILVN